MHENNLVTNLLRLKSAVAAERVLAAGRHFETALKYNPYWRLQPRVPAGVSEAGRWLLSGPLAPTSVLPAVGRLVYQALRRAGARIAPMLRRIPERWREFDPLPTNLHFPDLDGPLGKPSARRPGHEVMRFRTERELRAYLGPAGPGRQWHHNVERRLDTVFPPELIHSTDNIINLPTDLHQYINARMSENGRDATEDLVRRFYVGRFSFRDQYNYGLVSRF